MSFGMTCPKRAVNSEIAALGISNAQSSSLMPELNPTG
ncbi:hypothetical protein Syncc8109_1383 [Synechococcus sp. WH 8109]|nr:hypothetical protein Syncc8109_1383 [Synechococcus sp. WH 8109]